MDPMQKDRTPQKADTEAKKHQRKRRQKKKKRNLRRVAGRNAVWNDGGHSRWS
jgi:hypothetical protein